METMSIAREVAWQIPFSFKVTMYLFFFVALGFFLKNLWDKYQFVVGEKGYKDLAPEKLNWKGFIETIFFTGKVTRNKYVGIFHSLIYYGFIILTITTEVVAIHADTPLKIYKGPIYIVLSFLADFAGLAIVLGLILAYKRRYMERPEYLSATKPKREMFMYGMIVALILIGFLLEGIRISATGMPSYELTYSPIGYLFATVFSLIPFSEDIWIFIYRALWALHMINTMAFLATLPSTKFLHMIMAPINALLTPKYRGGVLNPMNFEDETAETFGLGKIKELTSKMKLDTLACVECGRCTQVCPAYAAKRPLNPKEIVTKMRDLIEHNNANPEQDFWDPEMLYSEDELDSCTTCGACMEECPMNIEHVQLIMELKRYKGLTLGMIPADAGTAVNNIKINNNPWGVAGDDRFNWAKDFEVPVAEAGKEYDYLYFVGCAGSLDDANQKVVKDTMNLFKKAGVSFAVIGKDEICCGDPIRRFGDEYSFFEVATQNIEIINQINFKKIVSHCPHCLHTLGKEYSKFDGADYETIHHTTVLADLIKQGKLKPTKPVTEKVTYHDPCYLGRHAGEYDSPRQILNAIPGINLAEMDKSKDTSQCCGMGGGNMWYEIHDSDSLAVNRLKHVTETNAEKLATACSYCMINFNSERGPATNTEDLGIEDIATILSKSVE